VENYSEAHEKETEKTAIPASTPGNRAPAPGLPINSRFRQKRLDFMPRP
jgi:hypothetical protein